MGQTKGTCDVLFDVDIDGVPTNAVATCTDRIFEREAIRAVEGVRFAPEIISGEPTFTNKVVYPLEFSLVD
ncbi:MAG: energy transducer TonB [Henriciella sp.]